MDLLQPRIISEKQAQYGPEEVINEAKEEDKETLLSEYPGGNDHQMNEDFYDGNGSLHKNTSSDQVNIQYMKSNAMINN